MKAKDMREKSTEDLAELEKSITRDAFQARFKNFTARLDDTSSLKKARRDVARVKTILAERKNIGEATPSKSALTAEAAPVAKKTAKAASKSVATASESKSGTKSKTAAKKTAKTQASEATK
jgi:large subunit ribosomal protein L29